MNLIFPITVIVVSCLTLLVQPPVAYAHFYQPSDQPAEQAPTVLPTVKVVIYNQQWPVGQQLGFFVSDSMLLTAAHGVAQGDRVVVSVSDGALSDATVIDLDLEADVARIACPRPEGVKRWQVATQPPRVGDAVRRYVGVAPTVTSEEGLVLTFSTSLFETRRIETNLPCSHGDSGGPLIQGDRVVGIVSSFRQGVRGLTCAATPVDVNTCDRAPLAAGDADNRAEKLPPLHQALMARASLAAANGNPNAAINVYSALVKLGRPHWKIRYNLSRLLLEQSRWNDVDRAIADWSASGDELWLCEYVAGLATRARGRPAEAVAPMTKSFLLRPNADVLVSLCDCLIASGDLASAEALAKQGQHLAPDNARFSAILSRIHRRNGRAAEAVAAAREAYTVDCRADNLCALVECLWEAGLPEEASDVARKLERRPDATYRAYSSCAFVLWKTRLRTRAIRLYEFAVEDDPSQFDGWVALGRARSAVGEFRGCVAALERAVECREDARIMIELGGYYSAQNRSAEYSKLLDRLDAISPESAAELRKRVASHNTPADHK